ncbi:hypothetical protein AK812_SmicGene843 [Symbiodinium microadriaticum]|uniref:Uncharacterized protein n=1 Tax=Symbiodinium microadriaticum TaxID=2951 RepID=A0A1Q9F5N4_SYMMI|nr:hypothetical protein AK812_SmicGene843 [Symbiodinium microadriaticum]
MLDRMSPVYSAQDTVEEQVFTWEQKQMQAKKGNHSVQRLEPSAHKPTTRTEDTLLQEPKWRSEIDPEGIQFLQLPLIFPADMVKFAI